MSAEPVTKKARLDLPVVLGTSSVWRQTLFKKHFPEYGEEFMAADIDEKAIRAESAEEMTVAIASAKADRILNFLGEREVLLVTMDQVVRCDNMIREKPANEDEARAFLNSYRQGKSATCVNGMVVHNTRTGKRITRTKASTAYWNEFPETVVDALLKKGQVMTTAGGFVVADPDLSPYLDRIEGGVEDIEGLPVAPLREMLLLAYAPAVTHVIFDNDGLLLDTETAYTVAQQRILDRWGKTFTWDMKAKMMGKKALDAAEDLLEELDLKAEITAESFVAERQKLLDELFVNSAKLPGADRLVRHLHQHGIPMAVATASSRSNFELKTNHHKDLYEFMSHFVVGDDVKHAKPDPEIFKLAAERFAGGAPDPGCVLVFEDASNGVEAALNAGMQVCHVPDANLGQDARGRSFCEITSLEKFKPEDWGLPPF